MVKIGLISDTHGYFDETVFDYFKEVDEIWHAGDIGNIATADKLADFKPLFAVYGNIDGRDVRIVYPEYVCFKRAGLKVLIVHIGGYPGRYSFGARQLIERHKPGLFVCGHSHILKVMRDKKYGHLCMNPGAAGNYGFHHMKTLLRFDIDQGKIKNLEAIELGKRGQ